MTLEQKLRDLCESAILNHCPNGPPCGGDEGGPPDPESWCSICLLVADIHASLAPSQERK